MSTESTTVAMWRYKRIAFGLTVICIAGFLLTVCLSSESELFAKGTLMIPLFGLGPWLISYLTM